MTSSRSTDYLTGLGVAREHATSDEVLSLLDYPSYFELTGRPLPDHRAGILSALEEDALIRKSDAGSWNITNLGAVLFAKKLTDFGPLGRKAVRVMVYEGGGRLKTLKEQVERKGYAAGFETLIAFVNELVPSNEVIGQALRKSVPMYPELAVRELVANALIHQDFFVTGAGPMVELFADRLELTNPGEPLVAADRFVDAPPRSRNEALASLMRRMGICEERGSGVDKIVSQIEAYQLPAPLFEVPAGSTRAVLFAHRPLTEMDRRERLRACYRHACVRYVLRQPMTNSSLRERFGIERRTRPSPRGSSATRWLKASSCWRTRPPRRASGATCRGGREASRLPEAEVSREGAFDGEVPGWARRREKPRVSAPLGIDGHLMERPGWCRPVRFSFAIPVGCAFDGHLTKALQPGPGATP